MLCIRNLLLESSKDPFSQGDSKYLKMLHPGLLECRSFWQHIKDTCTLFKESSCVVRKLLLAVVSC